MKLLAVDYGDARTGLAHCDSYESIAAPLATISDWNRDRVASSISERARSLGTELIIVGLPVNMDGSMGERAMVCQEFSELLHSLTGLPVELRDERLTTVQAHGILSRSNVRGKKRKAVVDTVAAVLILEEYLDYRRKKGIKP